MIDIRVKTKNVGFSVPVPYAVLSLCVSIISSNFITSFINKQTKKNMVNKETNFSIPPLDKKLLKQLIRELKNHKGTELVHVKAKDGSEVSVKL